MLSYSLLHPSRGHLPDTQVVSEARCRWVVPTQCLCFHGDSSSGFPSGRDWLLGKCPSKWREPHVSSALPQLQGTCKDTSIQVTSPPVSADRDSGAQKSVDPDFLVRNGLSFPSYANIYTGFKNNLIFVNST